MGAAEFTGYELAFVRVHPPQSPARGVLLSPNSFLEGSPKGILRPERSTSLKSGWISAPHALLPPTLYHEPQKKAVLRIRTPVGATCRMHSRTYR